MMAKPQNRDQFKDLVKRKCGYPVIELEIADEQIEDCIDTALQYYHDYHFDATERAYYKHLITAGDRVNGYITLPDDIQFVTRILDLGSSPLNNSIFGARYQFALNDFFNLTSGSLLYYSNTMRYISLVEEMFATRPNLVFSRHTNHLYLDMDWNANAIEGQYLLIECNRIVDPAAYTEVWNDRWLKEYTAVLVQLQIGYHLSKYNIQLPGGVNNNGAEMHQRALDKKKEMEDEMISKYSTPAFDCIG